MSKHTITKKCMVCVSTNTVIENRGDKQITKLISYHSSILLRKLLTLSYQSDLIDLC